MTKTCKNCLYSIFREEIKHKDIPNLIVSPEYVICKRYPPKSNLPNYGSSVTYGSFPKLKPSSWCGEYKSNIELENKRNE